MQDTLLVTKNYNSKDKWGRNLLYHLSNHPNISIDSVEFPPFNVKYNTHFIPCVFNGINFIIDDNDFAAPSSLLLKINHIPEQYLTRPLFILKIQYSTKHKVIYEQIHNKHGIHIIPFTMFSNCSFELENFDWENRDHEFMCVFTGQSWKNRSNWIEFAENNKQEINCKISLKQGRAERSSLQDNLEYYDLLKQSRWGVILKGYGDGGKNRREVEFSSLGMPLALNYIPEYPFDFIPNTDYIYLEKPEDILNLKNIDPIPFSKRSSKIYHSYFSPSNGIYNSFKLVHNIATRLLYE